MKKKRPFTMNYKTYDTSQGFGNVAEWGNAFKERMGINEAQARIGSDSPLGKLGLTAMPGTLAELRKHYHRVMLKHQSCFSLTASIEDQAKAKDLIAAYTVLENQYGH